MPILDFFGSANKWMGDGFGSGFMRLFGKDGSSLSRSQREYLPATQEGLMISGKSDQYGVMMRVDRKGNIITGNYLPELVENFEGATLHVQKWTASNTTFAPTQSTLAGYQLNPTALTTASAVAILSSQRVFYKFIRVPLQYKNRKRHSMVSGSVADFGWGIPAGTTLVVPNGVCFRMTASGVVQGVITYNGAEVAITNIVSQVASNGNTIGGALNMNAAYYTVGYFVYDLIVDDDNAIFTIQDTSTGEMIGALSLPIPNLVQKMWGATALPVYERLYNGAAPASAPVLIITDMQVLSTDVNNNMDASQIAGNLGLTVGRHPFTGAPTNNHTNNFVLGSATLSNTAAGYAFMDGKFQFATVAGVVTDYALFAFQIPVGSKFICEGVRIDCYNTGAAVATTPTILEWTMGFNGAALSLVTANIVRKQIGIQTFAIADAVGKQAVPIDINFTTPEPTESGRYITVILNMPVGTATASQIIRGTITVKGRFI